MGLFAGFEWDPHKDRANVRRHGVGFADAVAVFEDERAITMRDDLTAVDEQRWLTLGRDTREGRPDPSLLRPPRHGQRAPAVPRGGPMKRRKESYDFSKGRRGAVVPVPPGKTRITIRIDTDVLDWFRQQVNAAGGGNYQTLMNQALRTHAEQREDGLEEMLRRVLREELQRRRRRSSQ